MYSASSVWNFVEITIAITSVIWLGIVGTVYEYAKKKFLPAPYPEAGRPRRVRLRRRPEYEDTYDSDDREYSDYDPREHDDTGAWQEPYSRPVDAARMYAGGDPDAFRQPPALPSAPYVPLTPEDLERDKEDFMARVAARADEITRNWKTRMGDLSRDDD